MAGVWPTQGVVEGQEVRSGASPGGACASGSFYVQ